MRGCLFELGAETTLCGPVEFKVCQEPYQHPTHPGWLRRKREGTASALCRRNFEKVHDCLDARVMGHAADCRAARRRRYGPGNTVAGLQRRRVRTCLGLAVPAGPTRLIMMGKT